MINKKTTDYLWKLNYGVSFLIHTCFGVVFFLLPVIALLIAIVACLIVFDPSITLDIVQAKVASLVNQ